jgi:hypothetical protein
VLQVLSNINIIKVGPNKGEYVLTLVRLSTPCALKVANAAAHTRALELESPDPSSIYDYDFISSHLLTMGTLPSTKALYPLILS